MNSLLQIITTRPVLIIFYASGLALLALGFYLRRRIPPSAKYQLRRERKTFGYFFIILSILPFALGYVTEFYSSNTSAEDADPSSGIVFQPKAAPVSKPGTDSVPALGFQPVAEMDNVSILLQQAVALLQQNHLDEAMVKVNAAFAADPKNWTAFYVRGNIYAVKEDWDKAEKDYQVALEINGPDPRVQYNLADIHFLQKKYVAARPGFAALEQDSAIGDLCSYKVFLCDLYGGFVDTAGKELAAFNQVGANASYYFANAAWSLYHQKGDEAQGWLAAAAKIYDPPKFRRYSASLRVLGYTEKLNQDSLSNPLPFAPDSK